MRFSVIASGLLSFLSLCPVTGAQADMVLCGPPPGTLITVPYWGILNIPKWVALSAVPVFALWLCTIKVKRLAGKRAKLAAIIFATCFSSLVFWRYAHLMIEVSEKQQEALYGHLEAQIYMGYVYEHGIVVSESFEDSAVWYLRAASQNPQGQAWKGAVDSVKKLDAIQIMTVAQKLGDKDVWRVQLVRVLALLYLPKNSMTPKVEWTSEGLCKTFIKLCTLKK